MTSTIDLRGAYDALEKALPGEPIFPLLGRDPAAPAAVTEWARIRRNRAFRKWGESHRPADKELLAAELKQCCEAEEQALQFTEWREQQEGKASEQQGERANYQGVIKSAEEQAEAARLNARAGAVRDLREAAYHLSEALEALDGLGVLPERTKADGVLYLARINGLAEEHSPKRPGVEPTLQLEGTADG